MFRPPLAVPRARMACVPVASEHSRQKDAQMAANFKPGDCVIYRKPKFSVHPGPHARDIHPAPHGDSYSYWVGKWSRGIAVRARAVVVRARRGGRRALAAAVPALRLAHWWERL